MIRLESYGDRLKENEYRCHSRFKSTVNFYDGRSMVALVDRQIGPGPNHIMVSGLDPQKAEHLSINADGIVLDGEQFPFMASCRYDSRIDLDGATDRERFAANLEYFVQCLGQSATPTSLAFFPGRKIKRRWRSALERSIADRLRMGSKLVFGPDILAGIQMVKGVGFGLTPSGDDFNGGVLLALHCAQRIFKRDFERTIQSLCRLANGGNPFSDTMLAYASAGRSIGKIKGILAALMHGDEKDILHGTGQLRTIGHSSGIDFGSGMALTFKKLIRTQGDAWW